MVKVLKNTSLKW